MKFRSMILPLTVAMFGMISATAPAQGLLSNSDLDKILAETSSKQIIGLGDVWHTSGGFYKVKAQGIEHLISQGNLRNLAWEESWNSGEMVNSWLKSCQEAPADVVGRLRFIWRSEEIKDLFAWLCTWNQSHPKDQVSFMGFDIQDTWSNAEIIESSLGASQPALVKSIRENCFGASSHSKYEYIASRDYEQLSQALNGSFSTFSQDRDDACRAAMDSLRKEEGQRIDDSRPLFFALASLIGNHKAMTTRIAGNVAQADQIRDSAMFQLLEYAVADYSSTQTAVWTPNYHMATASLGLLGDQISQKFEDQYFPIGLTALQVGFNWPGMSVGMQPPASGADFVEVALANASEFDRYFSIGDAEMANVLNFTLQSDSAPVGRLYRGLIFLQSSPGMTICCQ